MLLKILFFLILSVLTLSVSALSPKYFSPSIRNEITQKQQTWVPYTNESANPFQAMTDSEIERMITGLK